MHRVFANSVAGAKPTELMALICAGPRGGTIATVYLTAARAIQLADELEAAARAMLEAEAPR